jgi:hypothetical protein
MTIDLDLARRPLPTLAQWINRQNGGERAEGFDDLAALSNLAERTILQSDAGLPVEQACFLRLWQGMCIATVELCNIERAKGVPMETVIASLPRALACAAVYTFASVMTDESPLRGVAKILTEEFRFAAKAVADDLEEKSR